ncbi:FAD-dependent oxidoreductase [Nocardia sp. BMG111209]|uniref:FAD-dependent oxidoreductase n=1 Tax=Nocardia sp. BMG111209 TaxID=1160137 RepID=UPI00036F4D47|nr:FAD-binding protein [Nocardia sp. BMG111209]
MGELVADVLVVGGGPAGAWAALAAARGGVRVVLVEKGRCGSSGPTARGPVSLWFVPPGPAREEAVRQNYLHGGCLGDPEWMHRVLEEAHRRVEQLIRPGHRGSGDRADRPGRVTVEGADYLGKLRRSLVLAGVRILDHHPALQLLVDAAGTVGGATGVRLRGGTNWTVHAAAVVVATGGCAFLSGGPGTDVATGDGLLMAAEAGGELSGMEFSNAYSLAPVGPRRPAMVAEGPPAPSAAEPAPQLATLYDHSGAVLGAHDAAFAALADGQRVYAAADPRAQARESGPGRVLLRAVAEGTVRGTGGLRLTGFDCATTVPGLFAAGDVATREPITGAVGGFGGQGGAWAISSGAWAGTSAARFAAATSGGRARRMRPVPGAGLNAAPGIDPRAVIGLVQEHTLPLRRSYWRSAGSLRDSITELDALWPVTEFGLGGSGADRLYARQAAALLAVARWTKYSALARTETRGMHRRTDHPGVGSDWRVRLVSGGVESVWVRPEQPDPDTTSPWADLTSA